VVLVKVGVGLQAPPKGTRAKQIHKFSEQYASTGHSKLVLHWAPILFFDLQTECEQTPWKQVSLCVKLQTSPGIIPFHGPGGAGT